MATTEAGNHIATKILEHNEDNDKMLKRIDYIKNMAVFSNFNWKNSVKDAGNNLVEFEKINILYGRNYSGKTTLSRILRAFETGSISEKYGSPEFQISFDGGNAVKQNHLNTHNLVIRVFNEDFVRDNLHFIVDDEQTINSFAILGKDNTKLEEEIKEHESELGNEKVQSGLLGELLQVDKKYKEASKNHDDKNSDLEKKLKDKANTDIKHNKSFGDARYNVTKIKKDISTVTKNTYSPLSDKQKVDFYNLLREEPKSKIPESSSFDLRYSVLASKTKELVEKKIQASDTIQELLNDVALASWVRDGRTHHENKKDKCAFCGNPLPEDLWNRLDKHFNQESEELRQELESLLESIEKEKAQIPKLLEIKNSDFYSKFNDQLDDLAKQLSNFSTSYQESLDLIKKQVEKRKNDIFTPLEFEAPKSVEKNLNAVRDSFEKLRHESNQSTNSLTDDQDKARTALCLHEVYTFKNDIKYENECAAIESLKKKMQEAEETKNSTKKKVDAKREKINELKAQLKDESKGAERVNNYLNNFFGHQSLSLKAIKENPEDASSGYRFEVTRNDEKAFHLSEGERSLVAFCYFMAKLEDIDTKGNQPIIWIDDPISSLDTNHIFFIYSLINAEIVKQKNFLQLFIATHNLNFLKYLKRISKDYKGKSDKKTKIREFFLVERSGDTSQICLMPRYLKNYITEFNYLFNQIYNCSKNPVTDKNYHEFYNFGNNARKFLEIYLYYRYPNGIDGDDKLSKFFGNTNVPAIFTDRVNNEYSHLCGSFERGAAPVDVPEMQKVAKQIISKIEEKDPDQYSALLQSIGAQEKLN